MARRKDWRDRWAGEWYSRNQLDGVSRHLLRDGECNVKLFRTRRAAREWIKAEYGYIARRPDLRREPFGWRLPSAVRVRVTYQVTGSEAR